MNIGFLRSSAAMDELKDEFDALEKAGCDRIVVDNAASVDLRAGMLGAVINRLSSGDSLVVFSLDSVAESMPELVDTALALESRNVRLISLQDGFDTHGRNRATLKAMLQQLQGFRRQCELRREKEAATARRVGRPRALSPENISLARQRLGEGRNMDEVARELRVSRATLYRYLHEGRG